MKRWGGLVGWIVGHINFCRLFNVKSILMQIENVFDNQTVHPRQTELFELELLD